MTWNAKVTRGKRFWIVEVPGVGVTQARSLAELDDMTSDLIEIMTDQHVGTGDIEYSIELPATVRASLDRVEQLRASELAARTAAAEALRAAARELRNDQMTLRDIGRVLGVSYQRAHQLVSDRPHPADV